MENFLTELLERSAELMTTFGLSFLAAGATLIFGFWVAGRVKNFLVKSFAKTDKIDKTVTLFIANASRYIIIIITILAVLDRFGVETTSFVTLIGAAGLAIGLALQGTLSNVAAGVMLLFFRPFKVGDFIDAGGIMGTVNFISLFSTHIDTADNVRTIVPNSTIWGSPIKNFNHNPVRRLDMVFGISYGDNIGIALKIIRDLLAKNELFHKDPEPQIGVDSLGDSSVNLVVRVWCDRPNYITLKWELNQSVKEAFDAAGIEIPFPQRVLHNAPK